MISSVNFLLAFLTILAQAFLVFGVMSIFVFKKSKVLSLLKQHSLLMAAIVSTFATASSLFYSSVAGFEPCVLCWYERIFMFPLPILLWTAVIFKDRGVVKYATPLVALGVVVSLYHNFISWTGTSLFNCDALEVSCTQLYVFELGYVTIPLMALTAFALVGFFLYLLKNK